MQQIMAWRNVDRKFRHDAQCAASAWLPACGEADIRRMLLVLLGEWTECKLEEIDAGRVASMIPRVERILTMERGRARSGSRAYDLNRHIACCQLLRALRNRLQGASGNAAH